MQSESMPLKGLRVIDAGTMIAAPWAGTYLGDFGAEVIKVEHPKYGDPARKYGMQKDKVPLFWKSLNRNKKGMTLNLSKVKGQSIFKDLVKKSDVLIENFRPGTLEKWGIGWDELSKINPSLIMLRTTGFGQEGPYAYRRGFGTVAEGMSGFTSVNGYPDRPPTLPGIPLADGVTSVFGALSIMIALYGRENDPEKRGQYIDISLYEPLMRFLEPHLIAYNQLNVIAQRMGNASLQTAPRNSYQTKDGKWVALSASTQSIAENVFKAIGRDELITDHRFKTNEKRLQNIKELDEIIGIWVKERNLDDVVEILNKSGAVVGPMYDVSQIFDDPHYLYRESFVTLQDEELGEIKVPNVFAKFSRTPGQVKCVAPKKGEHNKEILQDILALSNEEIKDLESDGVL